MKTNFCLTTLLFVVASLLTSCGKKAAIEEAHNQLPEIEQDMVDRYNAAGLDVGVKAKVIGEAINRIKEIDVGKCPDDYQDAWNAQLEIMEEWEEALETADMFALPEILKRRENAAKKLTKVARNHGLTEL